MLHKSGEHMKKAALLSLLTVIAGCFSGILFFRFIEKNTSDNNLHDFHIDAQIAFSLNSYDISDNSSNNSYEDDASSDFEENSVIDAAVIMSSASEHLSADNSSKESTPQSSADRNDVKQIKSGEKIGTTKLTGQKVLYLTFDDGPSELTPQILDILDKYDVKATFFVTGFATDCSKYIKEAHDRGHTIGMHTYSHDYSNVYKSAEAYYKDLSKISKLCEKELGFIPHYIRFPGGSSNTVSSNYCDGIMTYLSKDVLKKGYQYYDWNCTNGDAVGGKQSVGKLYKNAIEAAGGTDLVMLCHDSGDKKTTVDSLSKIIEYYQAEGYVLKAIDDTSYVPHHSIKN